MMFHCQHMLVRMSLFASRTFFSCHGPVHLVSFEGHVMSGAAGWFTGWEAYISAFTSRVLGFLSRKVVLPMDSETTGQQG